MAFYEQSLEIKRQIRDIDIWDTVGEADSLTNLGSVYRSLGEYQRAIAFYEQSLEIKRQIGDEEGEASSLGNLGNVYRSLGEYQEAIAFYEQSLEIKRQIGDRQGEANSLNNLGNAYDSLGEYQQAIAFYEQSLEIARQIGDRQGEAASLGNLGLAYRSLGEYQQAIAFYEQSLEIKRQIGDRGGEAASLNNLGLAYLKSNKPKQAESVLRQGIQLREKLREGLPDTQRISIFETQAVTYRLLQQTLIALNQPEEALAVSEWGRTRSLMEQLSQKQNITYKLPTVADLKQVAKEQNATVVEYKVMYDDFQLEGREQYKESELYIWVIQPDGTITFRSTDLKFLWDKPYRVFLIILLLPTLVVSGMTFAYAFYVDPKNRPSRRFITLTGLLTLTSFSGLFLTLSQNRQITASRSATAHNQSPQTPLGQLVNQSHAAASGQTRGRLDIFGESFGQRDKESLQKLHNLLIEPIADLLPNTANDAVIFIPDEDLFFVPFPALITPSGDYLIDHHTLSTAPSIQLLEATHQQKTGTFATLQGENALIVGNPVMPDYYDLIARRVKSLDPLPHSQREAETIAQLLQTSPLLRDAANETAITEKMPQAKLLHFATHGLLDGFRGITRYNLGAVALASDPNYDPQDPFNTANDGLLTAQEIYEMQLNADLVVLSACKTGLGRVTSDGIVGLSRAFINAGVPTVVMSLWDVPDAPTADLMTMFYENLQNGQNKAQAMREAMLRIKEEHPEPKHWAGFTVMGKR
ncbi:CHAT domain-containing protein [Spirulina sp. CS-785/01]|uniref:CHAT domain-containing protein n=1 Tax=Spirulina sp. CS-785/01 TaxID=3021716 RepID=UPI00232C1809|nr:CHAT domain-containing tetratricopeptide repeat protein [Spirulina sp. CS-785/01]MDB9312875.1 CHAT domain-containing protein [Spirulina sp. CS-785/01]